MLASCLDPSSAGAQRFIDSSPSASADQELRACERIRKLNTHSHTAHALVLRSTLGEDVRWTGRVWPVSTFHLHFLRGLSNGYARVMFSRLALQ